MAGQPRTRGQREGSAPGPKAWVRQAGGLGMVDPGFDGGLPPVSPMEHIAVARARGAELRQLTAAENDEAEEAELRNLTRMANRERMMRMLEKSLGGGGGGGEDSALATVLREMNAANQRQMDMVLTLLRDDRENKTTQQLREMREAMSALEQRLTAAAAQPHGAGGTSELTTALTTVLDIKTKMEETGLIPSGPTAAASGATPPMTRAEVLEQIRIEEEGDIRRAEIRERREEREFQKQQARELAAYRRHRLDSVFGGLDEYAGPILEAILGDGVKKALDKRKTMQPAADAATQHHADAAAAVADDGLRSYECPDCETISWAPADAQTATCPKCGIEVVPFPDNVPPPIAHNGNAEEPHHHFQPIIVGADGEG